MTIQSVNTLISQAQAMRMAPADTSSSSFASLLGQALEPARATAAEAKAQSVGLLTGQTDQIHSVVLAAEKADLALRLTLQIRNKVLDAYHEIMRMQV
jgi:flagellar hook-basal body complex protein FliE